MPSSAGQPEMRPPDVARRDASRTVAITGWGSVGPHGSGEEALRRAFEAGPPTVCEIDRSGGYHRPGGSTHAALVDPAVLAARLSPRQARRMSPPSRFAVVATREAVERAGLDGGRDGGKDGGDDRWRTTAVVTATAYGPSSYTEELLRQIFLDAPTSASPFLFTEAVANAPAAQVALALGARGPNITITQRQAGPLVALARAAREVASGRAERAIAVAVDEVNPLLHAALDRYGALADSRSAGDDRGTARPFDRDRRGFVLAEGATALVLEPLDAVRERGAPVLARVTATVAGFDPAAPVAGYGRDPEPLARRLRSLVGPETADPSALDAGRVDLVVAGASGSRDGDALEARVLHRAWGDRPLPPVLAPKATTGEHGGGLLAGALLALGQASWPATAGFANEDPSLGLRPWAGGRLPKGRRLLLSSLAVGGSASWTLLEGSGLEGTENEDGGGER